jgi:hypothetical protein
LSNFARFNRFLNLDQTARPTTAAVIKFDVRIVVSMLADLGIEVRVMEVGDKKPREGLLLRERRPPKNLERPADRHSPPYSPCTVPSVSSSLGRSF